MSAPETGLVATGLCKRYGAVRALEEASLAVRPGERVALIGHNGAGKTTLLRLALGLAAPDRGRITVCGFPPGCRPARQACAYLPETAAFHPALTGAEQIRLCARLKGVPRGDAARSLDRVGLNGAAARRIGTYSRGMRQRLALAQALLGAPRLVLLDEPTGGLDPDSRTAFYTLMREMAERGAAVAWSSHALSELEGQVDRVVVFRAGRILADGSIPELRNAAGLSERISVRAGPDAAPDLCARLGGRFGADTNRIEIPCGPAGKSACLARITALGGEVGDIRIETPGLDAVYRHYTGAPQGGGT